MTIREKLNASANMTGMIIQMSEGNPGAINVLAQLVQEQGMDGFMTILGLDDMNIRGGQIWDAYKDYAGCDMQALIEGVQNRDQALVDKVNEVSGYTGEKAVTHGASFAATPPRFT